MVFGNNEGAGNRGDKSGKLGYKHNYSLTHDCNYKLARLCEALQLGSERYVRAVNESGTFIIVLTYKAWADLK